MNHKKLVEEHPMLAECFLYKEEGFCCADCLMREAIVVESRRAKIEKNKASSYNVIKTFLTWVCPDGKYSFVDFLRSIFIYGKVMEDVEERYRQNISNN
jgi:hypothetical protein